VLYVEPRLGDDGEPLIGNDLAITVATRMAAGEPDLLGAYRCGHDLGG
jgi:hypothetical protein